MLDRLRSIVQKVNAAKDLQSALDIIVSRVRDALDTQVCSVFLFDAGLWCRATGAWVLSSAQHPY